MGVYNSLEEYAAFTQMTLEQAKLRYGHFIELRKLVHESRKCPKCNMHTLELEGGEWESGISDYIYCENAEIQSIDEEGDAYEEECDFTDDVNPQYLFAKEADFDIVLYIACSIENEGMENIQKQLGCSWGDFIEKENAKLTVEVAS